MKLWLLRAIDGDPLWNKGWELTFGFVIRAETEAEARRLATLAETNSETYVRSGPVGWASAEHSTCIELTLDGEPGVIITDAHVP